MFTASLLPAITATNTSSVPIQQKCLTDQKAKMMAQNNAAVVLFLTHHDIKVR